MLNIFDLILVASKSKSVSFLSLAMVIFVAGDLWIKYFLLYVSTQPIAHIYGDLFWLIGVIVGFYSLRHIRLEKNYNIDF
jgi:hypothetical protein